MSRGHTKFRMPSLASTLTDARIAEVYARTHFGNAYPDAVTPDDVKRKRASLTPPGAQACEPRARPGDLHVRPC